MIFNTGEMGHTLKFGFSRFISGLDMRKAYSIFFNLNKAIDSNTDKYQKGVQSLKKG